MKTKIEKWTIKKLNSKLDKINDQPLYQRGKVWSKLKNQLLIDSIFRGIDIPKIYFRKINYNGFEYEVADGQQRLHAINLFIKNELALNDGFINGLELGKIGKFVVGNKKINELKSKYPDLIKSFEENYILTIAILENASNKETRTLFGRLQEGSKLNPAEKRNAILSPIGTHIDNFVFNHNFFLSCKISPTRFRHQDYLAHSFALILYKNKYDLKANLLEKLYLDKLSIFPDDFLKNISLILDKMREIDNYSFKKIKNKFSFIDIFYFLFSNVHGIQEIKSKKVAEFYDALESKRIEFRNNPESLISDRHWGKDMYQYITFYKTLGYETESISNRNSSFSNLFIKFSK